MATINQLQDIANILRRDSLISTNKAGSGHPTTCMSCAEIMSVLFFNELKLDRKNAFNPNNDEFILSKGHAAPILYSAMFRSKILAHDPNTLRKLKSPIEGHPVPSAHTPFVKVASGSLGQGLSVGVGMALSAKLKNKSYHVYVLMGDSEAAEGSIYEAAELAPYYKLNNLIAILDVNWLGQRGETIVGHNMKAYRKRFEGLGWKVIEVNGHKIESLIKAFSSSKNSNKPTIILAKTYKGKGLSLTENKDGWHGKALNDKQLEQALKEIPNPKMPKISYKTIPSQRITEKLPKQKFTNYSSEDQVATCKAYGNALANIAKVDKKLIAIDAEVSNSTYSEEVKKIAPKQFVETFIAEQNMVGMALGLSKKEHRVFASTFGAFLTRAADQIRMAAVSKPSHLTFCGSHAGVSIGQDGVSQMALEDLAFFRTLPYSYVFYPSDAVSTEKLVDQAYRTNGIKYIRTSRPKTPILYKNSEKFPIGDFKVLKQSKKDKAILVGAGITTHEALKAHNKLAGQGIQTAVVDLYSVKPFKIKKFIKFAEKHGKKVIISEDHYPEGGIGEMLASGLINSGVKLKRLAVNNIPHSGTPQELIDKYGISSKNIVKAVKNF